MDRIDIHIHMPTVDYEKLTDQRTSAPSQKVSEQVEAAQEHQRARFAELNEITSN